MGHQSKDSTLIQKPITRKKYLPLDMNILHKTLADNFTATTHKVSKFFKYLCRRFPDLSEAKLKEGIFDGRHFRNDEHKGK